MWVLDHIEGWAAKNWCFQIMVLEKNLESLLDCKEVKPVNPKGNQPWIFIEKTDAEDEAPIIWPSDAKSWLIWKDPDAGKNWRQEEKATTEDEVVGWYHRLNGHEFEQTLGDGEGQWSLECFSPWCCKELDMIEWLNNDAKSWTGSHTQRFSESNQGSWQVSKLFLWLISASWLRPDPAQRNTTNWENLDRSVGLRPGDEPTNLSHSLGHHQATSLGNSYDFPETYWLEQNSGLHTKNLINLFIAITPTSYY